MGVVAIGDGGTGNGIVRSIGGVDSRAEQNVEAMEKRSVPEKFERFDGRRPCEVCVSLIEGGMAFATMLFSSSMIAGFCLLRFKLMLIRNNP